MKKAILFFLVLASIGLVIAGCGGGDGGIGSNNVLRSRIQSFFSDVNDEDLDGTMSNFSDNYLNDCFDWFDIRDEFETLFTEPNYSERWIDLDVDFEENDGNFGYAEGTFTIRVNDGGIITEEQADFAWDFVREDGRWVLYGNQFCNVAPLSTKKRTWLQGSARAKK